MTTTISDLDARIAAEDAEIVRRMKSLGDLLIERIAANLRAWRPEGGILDVKTTWGNFDEWNSVMAKILDRDGNIVAPAPAEGDADGRRDANGLLIVAGVAKQVRDDLETLESMRIDPGQIHF